MKPAPQIVSLGEGRYTQAPSTALAAPRRIGAGASLAQAAPGMALAFGGIALAIGLTAKYAFGASTGKSVAAGVILAVPAALVYDVATY